MSEYSASPPALPKRRTGKGRTLLGICLFFSVGLNFLLCGVSGCTILPSSSSFDDEPLTEKYLFGEKKAKDKIAVIRIEGPIMELTTPYVFKQIEQAAKDEHVKAIVLRVDSPGGTVTASDAIHEQLLRLRDGKLTKIKANPKPIIASFGPLAASGGYYVAMPAQTIFAERTTLTGSIGVYASLPNASELSDKIGFKMELIKAGGIKASGSPFHEMSPAERQPWQDMVDHSYDLFLSVVEAGRPGLTKAKLQHEEISRKEALQYDNKGNVQLNWWGQKVTTTVVRYRADGGTFTADEAKKIGLVDQIGTLEDAATAIATQVGLASYQVVDYPRPFSFLQSLFGMKVQAPPLPDLSKSLTPRIWYLCPSADLSGLIAAGY